MAEVLAHPDKDRDFSKSVFNFHDGNILIQTHDGERLTLANALLMLELAKQILIDEGLEG